jgi:multicomponent Na+:H+ antiporter subunit C
LNSPLIFSLAAAALFGIGVYGLLLAAHVMRKLLALNIMGSGVFLLFVTLTGRDAAGIPDPVPQAMVLTGIVIAVSATAFALALLVRLHRETGSTSLEAGGNDRE